MTLKGQTRDPNTLRARYLENDLSYRPQIWHAALYGECRAGAQIIFPESGRGLGHVTQQFLAFDGTYLQNYLSWRLQIWYAALYGECRAGAQIIFTESERLL